MCILPALDKIMIYASISSSTTVLLCVSPRCLSERILEFCIWPYGVNFGQFCPKWHDCWPGHCIMDELQPLISPWATSPCLSLILLPLFPLRVAKCIIQLSRVRGTERRWECDCEWVVESQNFWERERDREREREREGHTVSSLVTSAHTNTEDTSSVWTEISTK